MVVEIPVTQARAELADLVNRVVYGGERVVLTRHGRPVAGLVSAADLERLDGRPTELGAAPGRIDTRSGPAGDLRPPLRIAAQLDRPPAPDKPGDSRTSPWV